MRDFDKRTSDILTRVISVFAKIISSVTDETEHFNEIKRLINSIYNEKNWSILRLDETTNQLFFTVVECENEQTLKKIPIKLGEGICGQVASTGKARIVTELDEKPDFTRKVDMATSFQTKSIIAVPIKHENKILGVFEFINSPYHHQYCAHPSLMKLLHTLADFLGVIFSLSSIHQEIIFSSERDMLTGAYNRRYLHKIISDQYHFHGENHEYDVLLVMIDLNDFKSINDNHGHLVGDTLLKETARYLMESFRKNDVVVRYGGDEFLVLIECDYGDDNLEMKIEKKLNYISGNLPYGSSLAYGITRGKKEQFSELFAESDKKMYSHKKVCKLSSGPIDVR